MSIRGDNYPYWLSQAMVDAGNMLSIAYELMIQDVLSYQAIPVIHQWGVQDTYLLHNQLGERTDWIFGHRFIDIKSLSQAHSLIHGINCYGGLRKIAVRLGIEVHREKQHRAEYDVCDS